MTMTAIVESRRYTALWLAEEIAHVKLQLCQYAVVVKYTNNALGMMRSMILDLEKFQYC